MAKIKGMDISYWQGNVDFKKVAADGIKFAVLRDGYRKTLDSRFVEYVKGCQQNGIYVMAYHFIYTDGATPKQNAQSSYDNLKKADLDRITKYYINAVESRVKDLKRLRDNNKAEIKNVKILTGFRELADDKLTEFIKDYQLAMNEDDLKCVVDYFKKENRDPFETELRILDTYWSDHCRHTTFNTELKNITIDESFISKEMNVMIFI